MESGGIMNKLSKKAEDLLTEILEHRNEKGNCDIQYWKQRFDALTVEEDMVLRSLFKELKDNDLIKILWADDVPYILVVLGKGLTYFETKENTESTPTTIYTNNFNGDVSNVQIQQNSDGMQIQTYEQPIDLEKVNQLINELNKFDYYFDEIYGNEDANKIRQYRDELSSEIKSNKNFAKVKKLINLIKNITINVSAGLIKEGVLQLISKIGV